MIFFPPFTGMGKRKRQMQRVAFCPPKKRKEDEFVNVTFIDDDTKYKCRRSRLKGTEHEGIYSVRWKNGCCYYAKLAQEDETSTTEVEVVTTHSEAFIVETEQCIHVNQLSKTEVEVVTTDSEAFIVEAEQCIHVNQLSKTDETSTTEVEVETTDCKAFLVEAEQCIHVNQLSKTDETSTTEVEVVTRDSEAFIVEAEQCIQVNQQSKTGEIPTLVASDKMTMVSEITMPEENEDKARMFRSTSRGQSQAPSTRYSVDTIFDKLLNSQDSMSVSDNDDETVDKTCAAVSDEGSLYDPNDDIDYVSDSDQESIVYQAIPTTSISRSFKENQQVHVEGVTVRQCKSTKEKRVYDKIHYCFYCKKSQTKMARHLQRKHKDEELVTQAMTLPLKSKERASKLEEIRSKGDFLHNSEVIGKGKGELITWKSPSLKKAVDDFLACRHCFGMFIRQDLWKHEKSCRVKPDGSQKIKRVQAASAMITNVPSTASEGIRNILIKMNCDPITLAVKSDHTILQFGNKIYHRLGHDITQHTYIAQKMRELGRLLLELRNIQKGAKLYDVINPGCFPMILEAVRKVTGYDVTTGKYATPSLALKLGHSLRKCAYIKKADILIRNESSEETDKFISLMDMNWTSEISSHAIRTLYNAKWNKPLLLPLTEEIVKLQNYLKEEMVASQNELKNEPGAKPWLRLAKCVLASVVMFNRRRGGEASKMSLTTYVQYKENTPLNDEIRQVLSEMEVKLFSKVIRIEIQGKRGRKVPVLLTTEMKHYIDLLTSLRNQVGVESKNDFLFARPNYGSMTYIRAHECIREFAVQCGINPESVASTKLRKHVATLSQVINLKENELDMLATFMGHDIRVHREFYRLPESTLQVAKIGKLLLSMEQGTFHHYKGKSLDDIDVTEDDDVTLDEDEKNEDQEIEDNMENEAEIQEEENKDMEGEE